MARSLFVRGESNLKGCSSPISRFWSLGRFAADVGSDVFAAASYALTCALFRVACALTLLRLNSLFVMIQNLGVEQADADVIKNQVETAQVKGKSQALLKVNILPLIMLVTFIGLIIYFKTQGGYKPVELALETDTPDDAPGEALPEQPDATPKG